MTGGGHHDRLHEEVAIMTGGGHHDRLHEEVAIMTGYMKRWPS